MQKSCCCITYEKFAIRNARKSSDCFRGVRVLEGWQGGVLWLYLILIWRRKHDLRYNSLRVLGLLFLLYSIYCYNFQVQFYPVVALKVNDSSTSYATVSQCSGCVRMFHY
jgi:hypothetical protein